MTKVSDRIYHLSTCNTCQRIMSGIDNLDRFELIDIKQDNIPADILDFVKEQTGDYESIFSKRARKYRSLGLNQQELTEADYRKYILEEYTFLRRPVIIFNGKAFVGNSPKTVALATKTINEDA